MDYDMITIAANNPEDAVICGYALLYTVKGDHSIYSLNHKPVNVRSIGGYDANQIENGIINNWVFKTKSIITGTPTDIANLTCHPILKRVHYDIPDDTCHDYSGHLQEIHDKIRKR
jgi:hypothetical protein